MNIETTKLDELKSRQLWTLIEAAYLLAGLEPVKPHAFKPNSDDLQGKIYRDLKDAISLEQIFFVESRTGPLNNRRVKPSECLAWARKRGYEIPSELAGIAHDAPEDPMFRREEIANLPTEDADIEAEISDPSNKGHHTKPVPLGKIANVFMVKNQEDKNWEWWNVRTRNAKRYGLVVCRCVAGRGTRPSTWYPDLVACWLVDRKKISGKQAAALLRKHFPDCEETASQLEQSDG